MPLLEIALQSKQTEIVNLLIDLGYEINLRDWHSLIGQGQLLLEHGYNQLYIYLSLVFKQFMIDIVKPKNIRAHLGKVDNELSYD